VAGAWAATLSAMLVWAITSQGWFGQWVGGFNWAIDSGFIRESVKDGMTVRTVWLPWQMLAYISAGFAAGILVSLFSKPVAAEKLERFYNLLRTRVLPGEVLTEPCHLPEGATPGSRRVFFPNSQFEIPRPTWLAMSGFFAAWVMVAGIIGGVWWWVAV
jgi:hypothetical protein